MEELRDGPGFCPSRNLSCLASLVCRLTLCVRIALRMPYWSDWYRLLTYAYSKVYGLRYVRTLLDTPRV
eukprot:9922787-Ditylum_brightwellii.AAC.1